MQGLKPSLEPALTGMTSMWQQLRFDGSSILSVPDERCVSRWADPDDEEGAEDEEAVRISKRRRTLQVPAAAAASELAGAACNRHTATKNGYLPNKLRVSNHYHCHV